MRVGSRLSLASVFLHVSGLAIRNSIERIRWATSLPICAGLSYSTFLSAQYNGNFKTQNLTSPVRIIIVADLLTLRGPLTQQQVCPLVGNLRRCHLTTGLGDLGVT